MGTPGATKQHRVNKKVQSSSRGDKKVPLKAAVESIKWCQQSSGRDNEKAGDRVCFRSADTRWRMGSATPAAAGGMPKHTYGPTAGSDLAVTTVHPGVTAAALWHAASLHSHSKSCTQRHGQVPKPYPHQGRSEVVEAIRTCMPVIARLAIVLLAACRSGPRVASGKEAWAKA